MWYVCRYYSTTGTGICLVAYYRYHGVHHTYVVLSLRFLNAFIYRIRFIYYLATGYMRNVVIFQMVCIAVSCSNYYRYYIIIVMNASTTTNV